MKIIEGTSSFLANNTAMLIKPVFNQLVNLPEVDRQRLMSKQGFITQALAELDEIQWEMDHLTTVHSGATDKVYPLDDIGDITLMLGKQAQYVMSHSALKQSYLDGEIEIPGYIAESDKLGEDDPYYRAVYHGKLIKGYSGYLSKQWLTGRTTDLSLSEQMITLMNHQIITNELSDYLDYQTASPDKVDVDDNGDVIKQF